MRLKQISKQNKGMTLVELLVAIAIFAAAIIPMLYAFVYSTGYNFKSQRTMQSTGIAQAIIEKCKGQGVDATNIAVGLGNGTILNNDPGFTVGGYSPAPGGYWLTDVRATNVASDTGAGGVDSTNTSRRYYDVLVVFKEVVDNPIVGGDGSTNLSNGRTDSSTLQSMSGVTANFCDMYTSLLQSEDAAAQAQIISIIKNDVIKDSNVSGYPDTDGLASAFSESDIIIDRIAVDRYITITATNQGVNVKVEYYLDNGGYDGDSNGVGESGTFTLRAKSRVISGTSYTLTCSGTLSSDYSKDTGSPFYKADFDGTPDNGFDLLGSAASPVPPTAVFFYYYPGYRTINDSHMSLNDYFLLDNQMTSAANSDQRLDFYLFKQYDSSLSPAEKNTGEHNYKPHIEMKNEVDYKFDTYLYHNLLWDVADGSSLAAYAVSPVITEGSFCHNMTVNDVHNTSYAVGFRNPVGGDGDPDAEADNFESYVLSDYAMMPYRSEPSRGTRDMYATRYQITVTVYPAGDHSTPIESMSAEVLNW